MRKTNGIKRKSILILLLTPTFNDWVFQLYKKVTNLFICLAQQNDHEMFALRGTSVFHFLEKVTIPK